MVGEEVNRQESFLNKNFRKKILIIGPEKVLIIGPEKVLIIGPEKVL